MNKLIPLTTFVFGVMAATLGLHAHADGMNIKPGLWEITNKTNVNGQQMPDMKKMLANMPPEAQAQMKAMMEKNAHMGMTDKGMTVCVSAEQVARGEIGTQDPKSNCKTTDVTHSGDKTTLKMHCDAPHQADGTTEITRLNDVAWTSKTHMTTEKGVIDNEGSGKWLGADCGNIKPVNKN